MNLDKETNILASYLPKGSYDAKNVENSSLRNLLKAFASSIFKFKDTIAKYKRECNIFTATEFSMSLWEKFVGLPDEIFNKTNSLDLESRRNQVITKLFGLNIRNKTQYINVMEQLFPILKNSGWYFKNGKDCLGFGQMSFPIMFCESMDLYGDYFFIFLPKQKIQQKGFPFTFSNSEPFFYSNIADQIKSFTQLIVNFNKTVVIRYF